MARPNKLTPVNNAFYDTLGETWVSGDEHPVALLRAEAPIKLEFIASRIRRHFGPDRSPAGIRILDLGCGAGFLSNELAKLRYQVMGIDLAPDALRVARSHDSTGSVRYETGDVTSLSPTLGHFDVVCAMDILEHLENPRDLLLSASRVMHPGALLILHTFNRTPLAWLFASKGLEWFIQNTPPHLHVYRLFIRPRELNRALASAGFGDFTITGIRPKFSRAFFQLLRTRRVPADFRFRLSRSTAVGYVGTAVRRERERPRRA